jgi:pimeloyl-ACP methyl ester carboxylesterase
MKNLRTYGTPPFNLAVIHGGPGAPGEMAPVARELLSHEGVLEPLQTVATLEGQVRELRDVLEEHGTLPITLIGFSLGAMLSFIFTARYPQFVKKLILVGSGPYEEKYAANIMKTRISRLGKEDWESLLHLTETLNNHQLKTGTRPYAVLETRRRKQTPINLFPTRTNCLIAVTRSSKACGKKLAI